MFPVRQNRIQLLEQSRSVCYVLLFLFAFQLVEANHKNIPMRESEVERQFVEAVRAAGGRALKFTSQSMNGVPDRLVLLIGGKCAFVELKAPGKQMRLLQRKRRQQLEALGFPVFCVDRPEQIQPAIDALIHWSPGDPIPQGIGAKIPDIPDVNLPERGDCDG